MKVPILFYIYFLAVNTLMATGTGFIIGIFALRVPFLGFILNPITSPIVFLVICQFFFASFFWGKRRGEFEYSFLEKSTECGKMDSGLKIELKRIKQELKFGGINSAYAKLKDLSNNHPESFVIQFKYAISCERIGLAEDALVAYEKAKNLIIVTSKALIRYIDKQTIRIKQKGPSKRSSAPGLQYVMY